MRKNRKIGNHGTGKREKRKKKQYSNKMIESFKKGPAGDGGRRNIKEGIQGRCDCGRSVLGEKR